MNLSLLALPLLAGCIGQGAGSGDSSNAVGDPIQPRLGVDYSDARPTAAHLTGEGYTFVARYLSGGNSKDITASEAQALGKGGLDVVVVWELGGQDVLAGQAKGAQQAQKAAAEAAAVGMPADRPIYFAIDFDATAGQEAAIGAYFDGVASVIGLARTGAYGSYAALGRLFDAGKITWGWQTYAWSGGKWDSRAQLRQVLNDIEGGSMDKDQAVATDFGQWGASSAPPAPATCTANGVAGTCLDTSACAALTGFVSTAGHCAGPANVECCTPSSTPPPPPPPPASCTANGVAGTCISTSACTSMAGFVSTPGLCADATVECCTPGSSNPPPPPPPPSCTVNGVDGTCIDTSACAAMAGYQSTSGHCAGAANIECCTPPPACTVNGVSGSCIDSSLCASMGSTSTPGFCPGAANIECCTP